MILEWNQVIALGMPAHGLILHIHHIVEFWRELVRQPDQSILFNGQRTV